MASCFATPKELKAAMDGNLQVGVKISIHEQISVYVILVFNRLF